MVWPHSPVQYMADEDMDRQAVALVRRAFNSAMVEPPLEFEVKIVTVAGTPGPELVRLADRDDDLLVVGSGQRTLLGRVLRGSTATYCVAHADCPVLVVPRHALAKAGTGRALSRQMHRELRRLVDAA
jgi:nucleotide-binding universal stress UspA family protein